ncbi:hypothetical protein DPMN_010693 [Dreissena polymorpha]|uniref:Uncharacterized protein n=1 Tax=Dreissena polymorpha TaxID=45954 RepID=A0A9D4S165_DREPO|nr:hypothetical protein DPMN_010693 [Dreissena polymorpha]
MIDVPMKFHDPRQNCPPPSSHETNVLSKFHENWAKNVTSTVFTCFHYIHLAQTDRPTDRPTDQQTNQQTDQQTGQKQYVPHYYSGGHKNVPPTGGHVFSPIWTIYELVREINKTNVLTNFHDDWTKIVTSNVFTRFLYSQIEKTALPAGGHVFQRNGTTFELNISLRQTF